VSESSRRFGGYATLVAAGVMLSRVAGLIRQSVFAHFLGASGAADAFNVATRIPNILQNLLGEGVLSGSFIPVYSRLLARGEQKEADRVAGVFVSFLAVIVLVLVILGIAFAPVILRITAGGLEPPIMALAIKLTRIVFPGVGLLVLYAWALGILNAHRQFFISYVAPVVWNAAMIVTLLIFGMRMSGAPLATALAWGTVAGSALQFGVELPFVLHHAKHLRLGFDRSLEPVKTIFRNIGPVVAGRGVVQINASIDLLIASLLPTGAVSIVTYAQSILFLPLSVFGMSVVAAELPQMSSETGSEEEIQAALRGRLDRTLRQVAFFVIPTLVAYVFIGRAIVAAVFERGAFTPSTSMLVWYTLAGASVGLLAASLGRLYSAAFYALHDTGTPFRIALTRVIGSATFSLLLAFPLRPMFIAAVSSLGLPLPADRRMIGVVGITTASGIAGWIEFALLRHRIHQRIGRGPSKRTYMLKLWLSAITAGVAALAADLVLPRLHNIAEAALVCGVFGLVYLCVAAALGVQEVRTILQRFRMSS
jgi:putative peptidoglycan lipid II flippase